MKFIILVFTLFLIVFFSANSEKEVVSKEIVFKKKNTVVKKNKLYEQTQILRSMKEEVDELYDTTYKLNRLLIKKHQGESDVRHTKPRASRSRNTHRGRNDLYLTTKGER